MNVPGLMIFIFSQAFFSWWGISPLIEGRKIKTVEGRDMVAFYSVYQYCLVAVTLWEEGKVSFKNPLWSCVDNVSNLYVEVLCKRPRTKDLSS